VSAVILFTFLSLHVCTTAVIVSAFNTCMFAPLVQSDLETLGSPIIVIGRENRVYSSLYGRELSLPYSTWDNNLRPGIRTRLVVAVGVVIVFVVILFTFLSLHVCNTVVIVSNSPACLHPLVWVKIWRPYSPIIVVVGRENRRIFTVREGAELPYSILGQTSSQTLASVG
jgi:hypothetical protein